MSTANDEIVKLFARTLVAPRYRNRNKQEDKNKRDDSHEDKLEDKQDKQENTVPDRKMEHKRKMIESSIGGKSTLN